MPEIEMFEVPGDRLREMTENIDALRDENNSLRQECQELRAEMHDHSAAAFAALRAIETGQWDGFLLRLRAAANKRIEETK